MAWEITPLGEVCRLTLVHDDIHGESPTASFMASRWGPMVSGLKTLLETGEALPSVEGLPEAPTVDIDLAAHREQGVAANNRAWVLLGAPQRSAADDEQLVHAVHASAYHWGYAGTPVHQARAEYMCSRAYSVLGRAEPALRHAERCLEIIGREGLVDFDLAYAHEAVARALACGGRLDEAAAHLEAARAVPIADDEDRSIFDGDLAAEPWFGLTPAPSATVGG